MVDITLLGCGGGMPTPDRFLSSTLIRYMGRKILIDCGEGTQVSMKTFSSGFKTIDMICITHVHGDHIVGLPGLLSTIGNSGREESLTIIGPEGIENVVESLRVIAPNLPYEINVVETPNNTLSIIDDVEISTLELDHSTPCIGYSFYFKRKAKFDPQMARKNNVPKILWSRLQREEVIFHREKKYQQSMVLGKEREGIKLSVITDTRPLDTIPDFIRGSDLLICEANYAEDKDLHKAIKNKHMTFGEAANLAKMGSVKELLLTHFGPAIREPELFKENATNIFKETIIGEDGYFKSLSFKE